MILFYIVFYYNFLTLIKEIMIFMNINVRKSKLFFYNSKNFKV